MIPRLFVDDPQRLVDFLRSVFGARGEYETEHPTMLQIGDAEIMVSAVGPRERTSSCFYLYVDDADDTYAKALQAGATSIEAPDDMPWGDRRAIVTDPAGNDWQIATSQAG